MVSLKIMNLHSYLSPYRMMVILLYSNFLFMSMLKCIIFDTDYDNQTCLLVYLSLTSVRFCDSICLNKYLHISVTTSIIYSFSVNSPAFLLQSGIKDDIM